MKGKLVPMVGLAVVFGGLSIFVADRFVKSQTPGPQAAAAPVAAEPAIATRKILVATTALKYGSEITAESVQAMDWPVNSLPAGSFETLDAINAGGKRIVLTPISANEPILLAKLSGKDGRAALSNLLEPGMRAVSIRVDDITGVAGFVTPGDRVDVLLTREKTKVEQPAGELTTAATATPELASEVILENVKILTTDQSADQSATQATVARSVTVEVNSGDAQKVALAQQTGTLYLLLRSAGDASSAASGEMSSTGFDKKAVQPASASAVSSPSILSLENEGPKYRSLVVTRGHAGETFSVIDEKASKPSADAGGNN